MLHTLMHKLSNGIYSQHAPMHASLSSCVDEMHTCMQKRALGRCKSQTDSRLQDARLHLA